MPSSEPAPDVYYWDACVPLAYIAGEADRVPVVEESLRRARSGAIVIVTSVVAVTEVAFAAAEKADGELDPEVERRIDELWKPASPIRLVEFHRLLATDARDLMRSALARGHALSPADAIHLATALNQHATALHTYDEGLYKHAPYIGLSIGEPTNPQEPLFDA